MTCHFYSICRGIDGISLGSYNFSHIICTDGRNFNLDSVCRGHFDFFIEVFSGDYELSSA